MHRPLHTAFVLLAAAAMPALAQGSLQRRVSRLLDAPPFDRATWGVFVMDEQGTVLFERNADRLFIPASTNKLIVTATAAALLPPDFRIVTNLYGGGTLDNGVLRGDLIAYGRGDPTFSRRCYGLDTLLASACDSLWTRMDALADSVVARGVREIEGAVAGDGSFFDEQFVHGDWDTYDLNWWYAAPVSGLGFNDNSVDVTWGPGLRIGAPPIVSFEPTLGNFQFENRGRTSDGGRRTLDFFRRPGTMLIWAEGRVPFGSAGRTEYFALPDPNLYFAQALRAALERKGVSVGGTTLSTTDSMRYAAYRASPPLASFQSRSIANIVFPILNSSQNWFAEMLLKLLGRERGTGGSWESGLEVERRFLIDSLGVDSSTFSLTDASGLSTANLITPRALSQILARMKVHPNGGAFLAALPRAGQRGSLRDRFRGTPLEGRVVAKTGSISHVNALAGYIERPDGRTLVFTIIANNHTARYAQALAQMDSLVIEVAR